MAELTIRLEVDAVTRKKNVTISYHSDEDALPLEHEEDHRRLVDQLIEGGALKAAELGKIMVEREGGQVPQDLEEAAEQGQREAVKQDG